ncbi:CHY zinc finger protein [Halalkalirubrum salinum]|uniref:CHY zinc finger protein n=1 Tax=Halalkalirubrum salinum TaxID=2563889 RepID=UPI0010FB69B0|nr:CHY zinc finger protein [Halalkalirubrum salinum]
MTDRPTVDDRFTVPLAGVDVDEQTRCAHYSTDRDVIAIRFPCCNAYYPCFRCHEAIAEHPTEQWPRDRFDEPAVLCGRCRSTLSVREYLDCEHECPNCGAAFNPGCLTHSPRYFHG